MTTRLHQGTYAAMLAALVLAFVALPGQAATARRAVAGSLSLSDSTVAPGTRVTLSGSLPPQRARTVKLQRRSAGSWVTVTTKQSTSTGRFAFALTPTLPAGSRVYRVLAPATRLGGKPYAAVATPSRTLTVVSMVGTDAGWRHACAVGSNGSAWCWGDNTYGELGDGKGASFDDTHPEVSGPVRVTGTGWSTVSATGASTCGLKDHTAWCWGDHAAWVSGVPKAASPVRTTGLWSQVATSWVYACGVHTDGTGWCWGRDDDQLGTADPVAEGSKHKLPGTWTMIAPGSGENASQSTCGVRSDHTAWCWGDDSAGKLGDGGTTASATPVQVAGDHEWASVTVGWQHACGLTTDGAAWCWGENTDGRLGDGTFAERHTPVRVKVASTWRSLDAGFQHTCGVTTSGAGWCWGNDGRGQLGDDSTETVYYPAPKAHRLDGSWADLDAGWGFTTGAAGGLARAWGESDLGQTGFGAGADRLTPRKVAINP